MDNINDTEALREELRKINRTILSNKKAREELMSENKYGIRQPPMTSFIMLWVLCALIVTITVFAIVNHGSLLLDLGFGVPMTIGVTLLNLLLYLPRVRKMRKIDTENKELYAQLHEIEEKLKALER